MVSVFRYKCGCKKFFGENQQKIIWDYDKICEKCEREKISEINKVYAEIIRESEKELERIRNKKKDFYNASRKQL